MATSRCYYGAVLLVNGEVERGAEMARLAAEAAARLAIYPLAAESLSVLAISHAVAGDFANEREMHVARLAVAREHGDVARTADALGVLAEVALDEADSSQRARVRGGVAGHRRSRRLPDGGVRGAHRARARGASSRVTSPGGDDPPSGRSRPPRRSGSG